MSLVAAPCALIVAKGKSAHRLVGKLFFWCMTWIFVSATVLSIYRSNLFLLLIGVFSYYSVVTGYRSLFHKGLRPQDHVKVVDWLALLIATAFNAYFVYAGILRLIEGNGTLGFLCLLFGGIGLWSAAGNFRRFTQPPAEKNEWLFQHISGFMAGFIASVTAFSTQVFTFLPDLLAWTWPTMVGTPLIVFWIGYYRKKLNHGVSLSNLVEIRR